MVDYIIDENTGAVVKGDKTTDRYSTYRLDFIRKTGVKTKPGTEKVNTTNCPNCGAPTQITSSGKCEILWKCYHNIISRLGLSKFTEIILITYKR